MTDHPHKLNRLAMHQEWYDKNRPLLFIEASVVMQELLAMCRQYKAERDEARREACRLNAEIRMRDARADGMSSWFYSARQVAEERGWDCFKENTND